MCDPHHNGTTGRCGEGGEQPTLLLGESVGVVNADQAGRHEGIGGEGVAGGSSIYRARIVSIRRCCGRRQQMTLPEQRPAQIATAGGG